MATMRLHPEATDADLALLRRLMAEGRVQGPANPLQDGYQWVSIIGKGWRADGFPYPLLNGCWLEIHTWHCPDAERPWNATYSHKPVIMTDVRGREALNPYTWNNAPTTAVARFLDLVLAAIDDGCLQPADAEE